MENIRYKLPNIQSIAEHILQESQSRVVVLFGNVGSGKTTLIKAILKSLGCSDVITSPTFSIVNTYYDEFDNILAYHFDLYRLNSPSEIYDLGLIDYLNSGCWVFIEWPELIKNDLPDFRTEIILKSLGGNCRDLKLENFSIR
jgi:tRNA threonylcarbamoyladenosine biosynthesis protein TsaE